MPQNRTDLTVSIDRNLKASGGELFMGRIQFEMAHDTPNAETLEALEEVERMKKDPSLGKAYTDVDQMMSELLADVHG